jgi:hypothetical protein
VDDTNNNKNENNNEHETETEIEPKIEEAPENENIIIDEPQLGEITGVGDNNELIEPITESDDNDSDSKNDEEEANPEDIAQEMDDRYGEWSHNVALQPRRRANLNRNAIDNILLTQHSVKKGLKVFGEACATAVVTEMTQLDYHECINPQHARLLTHEERKKALNYLMFLKKKRCGRIKGHGCGDGRKQRLYKTKKDTSAPTAAIESLMLTCMNDAKEQRDVVVTADMPGAFMQAKMDELLHMQLEGLLAILLTKVNPVKTRDLR